MYENYCKKFFFAGFVFAYFVFENCFKFCQIGVYHMFSFYSWLLFCVYSLYDCVYRCLFRVYNPCQSVYTGSKKRKSSRAKFADLSDDSNYSSDDPYLVESSEEKDYDSDKDPVWIPGEKVCQMKTMPSSV